MSEDSIANVINGQIAPWPAELAALVAETSYKRDWTFELANIDRGQDSVGLTLTIHVIVEDSYHPGERTGVVHYFPVPPAAYDRRSWQRWLFEQVQLVERHEAMEFFVVAGVKPYAPSHGPGNDPYLVREVGTELDARTSFRGEVNP